MKLPRLVSVWRLLAALVALAALPAFAWTPDQYTEAFLYAEPDHVIIGEALTLRVYLKTWPALPYGDPVLSGTVDFIDADTSQTLCGAVPVNVGDARCTVAYATFGAHRVYAYYPGNADYAYTHSYTVTVQVDRPFGLQANLDRSSLYSSLGDPVTFTATLTGNSGIPTGFVDFLEGVTPLCAHVPLAGGVAACTVSGLAVGDHFIYGQYGGDAQYSPTSIDVSLHIVLNAPRLGETNVALASAGGHASDPVAPYTNYSVSALIDGNRSGYMYGQGEGWPAADSSVELDFAGPRSVDQVVVYSYYQRNQTVPTDTTIPGPFDNQDIAKDFDVDAWNGTQWVRVASVRANPFAKRIVPFAAVTTERLRLSFAPVPATHQVWLTELEAYGVDYENGTNVALASRGTVATASSELNRDYPVTAINNGIRAGPWPGGGWWADLTIDQWPDWVQLDFDGPQTLQRVVIYTVPDDYTSAAGRPDSATFARYGITDFTVDGWDGTQWVPLGTVTGNNLVRRSVEFAPFTTTRIRVNIVSGLYYVSRIAEIEAWGQPASAPPAETNWALASNGGVASASSQLNVNYPVSAVIDGDVGCRLWNQGGGWADLTIDQSPDWVQVNFAGVKTIDHVVVFTVMDRYGDTQVPDDTTTFTRYGIVDFDVMGWNGADWVLLGSVHDNNFVKRNVPFAPFTTDRIRIVVNRGLYYVSRITEVQAWGP